MVASRSYIMQSVGVGLNMFPDDEFLINCSINDYQGLIEFPDGTSSAQSMRPAGSDQYSVKKRKTPRRPNFEPDRGRIRDCSAAVMRAEQLSIGGARQDKNAEEH